MNERTVILSQLNQLVLIITGGVVSALACGISTCVASNSCASAGTCRPEGLCSFTNAVSLSAASSFASPALTRNASATGDALAETLVGVCAPGERLTSLSNAATCVPYFPFPSALNSEIEDPTATSAHMRACGAWISAGGPSTMRSKVTYRSSQDHESWVASIEKVENVSTYFPRTAKGNIGKFRAECARTALAGAPAIHAAATIAYDRLKAHIDAQLKSRDDLVRVEGYLTGHLCESSVRLGSTLQRGSFGFVVSDGHVFSSGALAAALQMMGEGTQLQEDAELAASEIRRYVRPYEVLGADTLTALVEGATGETNVTGLDVPPEGLSLLPAVLRVYDRNLTWAKAYAKGVAAFCVYSVVSHMDDKPSSLSARLVHELSYIKNQRPRASTLGRLFTDEVEMSVNFVEALEAASTITIAHVARVSARDADVDCLALMRLFFPDDVDEARFRATVHPRLYERLRPLVNSTRVAMAAVVTSSPINSTLADPLSVANDVLAAGVRIAGATRGSWAGIARPVPDAGLRSSDGMFLMLLKQSHSIFMDEVAYPAIRGTTQACDHSPLYASMTLNAYAIPLLRCTVIFLGMLKRPWGDAQYDDESLISRSVAIVGHELAHMSLRKPYVTPEYNDLLRAYLPTSTDTEAIADVIAAHAAVATGLVTKQRFVSHWCQLWCARVPWLYATSPTSSHPGPNERCDYLAKTMLSV